MSGYALVSIIHSEESVIFLKLYLCLALLSVLYTMCISSNMSQLVGLGGLEPPTSRLSGVRSNQLSYRPISVDWESLQISQNRTMLGGQSVDLSDIQALGSVYVSLERRWSSRTFRYGYLVTTSPQLSNLPSAAPSLRLGHWLRAFPTPQFSWCYSFKGSTSV